MESLVSRFLAASSLGTVLSLLALGMPAIAQELNPGKTAPVTPTSPSSTPSLSQDYANYTGMINQINSIDQLRDVSPQSWSYEALKNLVENYGCIVGYPDRTFRGNRALTRWEFAAGLNACLNTIERLLQENVAVLREDLDKLKQLSQQFEQELASMGARVDNLESRTAYLEDHQFSTTTKLSGDVILAKLPSIIALVLILIRVLLAMII